jgi:WD40 repeat protein
MANLLNRSRKYLSIIILVLIVMCSNSCTGLKENTTEATIKSSTRDAISAVKTPLPKEIILPTPETNSDENQQRRRELPVISIENASNLVLQEKIFPFFPEIVHIASGGRVAAVGDLSGIKIIDLDSGSVLMQVDVTLPSCNFGMDRYFQLNYDGAFLAVATNKAVQVWQVGGGIVYEAAYINNHTLDTSVCGADIPQMALSPDGMLLAESGMQFSATEVKSYFRVVDILKNTIVFEWDGKSESPNGQFYAFPGLGFSSDGKVLQTFDPSRFNNSSDDFHTAFRFWSTESWRELDSSSKAVASAFVKGELRFGVIKNDSISVFSKKNGTRLETIEVDGCGWENPCPMEFSPDGSKMAVLLGDEPLMYKRESISTHLAVYDLFYGKMIDENSAMMRNLDGLVVRDNGEIIGYGITPLDGNSTWWTYTNYFAGFHVIDEDTISFIPQVADYRNQQQLPYSGSCQIHTNDFAIECGVALSMRDGIVVTLEKRENGVAIIDSTSGKDTQIAEIKNPTGDPGDSWQIRLLDYVWETGTGFFCLDRNLRMETCAIMDLPNNEIFYEQIDLEGFQYSRKNDTAAFINKKEKSLYLFNNDTDTLKKMRTYRASSLPIKPTFLSGGSELIYMVQSLAKSENIYFERIDTSLGKVIKRYDIDELKKKEISSISASGKEELWAASDIFGNVYLIDPDEEAVIHIFRGAEEEIIDMVFNPDGKAIFMMGKSGEIQIWAVGE